ncbi:hypothetical protein [Serratia microhaemolytica]|uniref:hypothetical protein n=1 Tax=Serratia microhaemolytica TaxID=2675110 RepID=UPI000FDDC808|nr:hypothetical protein [Serratia microhaemolytica]
MITGVDYIFYSSKKPFDIESDFISLLKEIWKSIVIDEFERSDDKLELFFSRDSLMNSEFDNNGYSLDENGQGCFMLISKKINFFECEMEVKNITRPLEKVGTLKYESHLLIENVWEYSLVLPGEITESNFCMDVYIKLLSTIE